jgi:Glucose-6-phosphate dehydrogenase, NAD binding domain
MTAPVRSSHRDDVWTWGPLPCDLQDLDRESRGDGHPACACVRRFRDNRGSREGDNVSPLYRLDRRGPLTCPIVGAAVDDWTVDDLRQHAHKAIEANGEPVDEAVFERFAGRLSYLSGDFADAATFQRLAAAIREARTPVFYLEVPPFSCSVLWSRDWPRRA